AIGTTRGGTEIASYTNAGASTSVTWSGLNSLLEGTTYYASVRAYDAAGNRSNATSSNGAVVDLTAPIAPLIYSPTGAMTVHTPNTTISTGTSVDASVQIWLDANRNGVVDAGDSLASSQPANGTGDFNVSVGLVSGVNAFLVTATDPAGNISPPT